MLRKDLLFEYKSTPSYGGVGQYGGKSISVYYDGHIVFREYVIGNETPSSEIERGYSTELVNQIEKVIEKHKCILEVIPNSINCGVIDGSHDCFTFSKKEITAWTISHHNLGNIMIQNPEYYSEYKHNMIFENAVLDIYDEIVMQFVNLNLDYISGNGYIQDIFTFD